MLVRVPLPDQTIRNGVIVATKNDITGDSIQSRVSSNAYKDNYDAIFGKKKVIQVSEEAFDNFSEMLEDTQEPNKALSELMSRPKRWVENEKEESNDQAV